MGYYINPPNMTKEQWLAEHGYELEVGAQQWPPPSGFTIVCLVENPFFTAAGICYNEDEFKVFNDPGDPRQRVWWHVPSEDVVEVCPDSRRVVPV